MQSRNALARAYQNTPIDPSTGLPDTRSLVSNLAQDPAGALVLPQVIQGVQEQAKRGYELNAAALKQTSDRSAALNSTLGPLLRMGGSVTPGDVYSAVQQLHAAGFPTDEMASQIAAGMPTLPPSQANSPTAQAAYGQQLHGWLMNTWGRSLPADVQSHVFTPTVGTVNDGAATLTYDANPITNPGATGMVAPQMLSPGDVVRQVTGPVGPNGQPTVLPQGSYAAQNGYGSLIMPGTGGARPGSVFGDGRFPGAAQPAAATGGVPPASISPGVFTSADPFAAPGVAPAAGLPAGQDTAPITPGAPMATGLGPGQQIAAETPAKVAQANAMVGPDVAKTQALGPVDAQNAALRAAATGPVDAQNAALRARQLGPVDARNTALTSAAQEGQTQANALTSSAQDSPARQAQLQAMLGDLTKFGSGPNSQFFGMARARLVQAGVAPESWAEGQSAQENFAKMANQFLARQASSLGSVTNDKIALAAESGPNPAFTTLGNQGVLHIAQGNEDALNVRNNAWLQAQAGQGLTGADFPAWSAQFNQSFTPSAFWYSRMSPAERQTFIAGMSSQQKAQLQGNIVGAIDKGWIDPSMLAPSQAGGAAPQAAGAGAASQPGGAGQ